MVRIRRAKRVNRSLAGDILVFVMLALVGIFMAFPLVFVINNSFKPLEEIFLFPPKVWVMNPTTENFTDLFYMMMKSMVPFSRYVMNSLFITLVGTVGSILLSSMCAYPLAKIRAPGVKIIFGLIVTTLMFPKDITLLPNYLLFVRLNILNNYAALILPALASSLGLFLMKQFMESNVPDAVLESARIDGAGELRLLFRIVMPMVKPAWLTFIIFNVQALWNEQGSLYIYQEELKTLPYALSQILAGGIARTGTAAAAMVFTLIVPIGTFLFTQSNIIETLSSSGIKE